MHFVNKSKSLSLFLQPHLPLLLILQRPLRAVAERQIGDWLFLIFVFFPLCWIGSSCSLLSYIPFIYFNMLTATELVILYQLFVVALFWYHKQIDIVHSLFLVQFMVVFLCCFILFHWDLAISLPHIIVSVALNAISGSSISYCIVLFYD